MEKGLPPKGFEQLAGPDVFKANNGKNISKKTFKDKMTIGKGNDRIDLYYFGRGHTSGDAWAPAGRTRPGTPDTSSPSLTG